MFLNVLIAVSLLTTAFAALATLRLWWQERPSGIAVLLYHRVRSRAEYDRLVGAERNFSVADDAFEAQLRWLTEAGFTFVNLDDLAGMLAGERPLPQRPVVITFDDGSDSVLSAAVPLLDGRPAALFVTTDPGSWVFDDQPRLTDEQLRGAPLHIGAHGVSHRGLDGLSDAELAGELTSSRAELAEVVGRAVRDMAIPLNFYDDRVLTACRDAGYRMVFTANPGRVRPGADPMRLRRIAVEGPMSLAEFQRSLRTVTLVQRRIVGWLKRLPPRILGEDRWMPIRKRLFESRLGPYFNFRYLRLALLGLVGLWCAILVALAASVI